MLLVKNFGCFEAHSLFDCSKSAHILLFLRVRSVDINGSVARKAYRASACAEGYAVCVHFRTECFIHRACHLACNKSLPNQLIKLVLVGRNAPLYHLGENISHCRTDCFVRVLSAFSRLINARFLRKIFGAEPCADDSARRVDCFGRDAQ